MNGSATAGEWAVDLTDVAKTYRGGVEALRGVSVRVRRGEVFGLLGPNGAGKSTLVKILMTVIRPTRATGTFLGLPVGHKPTLARVGYLPEHHRFPDYLTGRQVIDFYGALAGTPRRERKARASELLDTVGMTAWADKRVKGYSKGMRQRVGIAQALVNDPEVVVLDEPTDGVDPVGRRDIRAIMTRMRDAGKTVLVNSHLLSELEMVSDRVSIMVQGKVAAEGTIDDLTLDKKQYELELVEEHAERARSHLLAALDGAGRLPDVNERPAGSGILHATLRSGEAVELHARTLRVRTTDPAVMQPMIDALRSRGATVASLRLIRPSLEDLFMAAVTDPTTGAAFAPGAAMKRKEPRP